MEATCLVVPEMLVGLTAYKNYTVSHAEEHYLNVHSRENLKSYVLIAVHVAVLVA
jgi:hypothetical protein